MGIFGNVSGSKRYGFIHGDWALDNSRRNRYCGANNEIEILMRTGCYADFTYPSANEANPSQINSIHYAIDDPFRPKSFDRGDRVRRFGKNPGGLMIVQGPLHPFFVSRSPTSLRMLGDAIDGSTRADARRVRSWVRTAVHVEGCPDVVFVKTHTHGATDAEAVLGAEMDGVFGLLEREFGDGRRFVLHYVTAREMYNFVKALEAGHAAEELAGLRDYVVAPPEYNLSSKIDVASAELQTAISRTYR